MCSHDDGSVHPSLWPRRVRVAVPQASQAADPIAPAVLELLELLAAVDVPPVDDQAHLTMDVLHSHIVGAAEDVARQSSKAALVLNMKDAPADGRAFVSKAVADSAALLVGGCQLLCMRCGTTKAKELKKLVRYAHVGCSVAMLLLLRAL